MKPYRIIVVVVAVAVLLFGCLGCGTTLLSGTADWLRAKSGPGPVAISQEGAIDLVYGFVVDLSLDHVDDAYAILCAGTKRRYSPAAFASYVDSHPKVSRMGDRAFQPPDTVTTTLIFRDQTSQRHTFRVVVEEEQTYHVCGDPY